MQTFYAQILMYLTIHICVYICFSDVQYLPEDDQDRSKHVSFMANCA